MTKYTVSSLKGFNSIFDSTLNNDIQDGLVEYFDWALLEKGNYFNVTKTELAPNWEDYSKLRLSANDHYNSGQVWEGFKKNWVWQSGISFTPAPLVGEGLVTDKENPGISGIYVDDTYYPEIQDKMNKIMKELFADLHYEYLKMLAKSLE